LSRLAAVVALWLSGLPALSPAQPAAGPVYRDTLHLRYGLAGTEPVTFLDRRWYVVGYDAARRIPSWTAYRACAESLVGKQPRRESFFQPDPWLDESARSTREDYKYSGFDRGHLVPAADFQRRRDAYVSTYLLSNMCPQYPRTNSGIWQNLEGQVRTMVNERGEAWIVTGTAFLPARGGGRGGPAWIGEAGRRRVAVPTHLFKAILARDRAGVYSGHAFLVPNRRSWNREQPGRFRLSVDSLELLTGLELFPLLDDSIEEACESAVLPWDWRK
jgi:endonuclease G